MPNFNKILLMGNLTKDPDCRYTPKGTAVCVFDIAINRHWTTESGEKKEEVVFISCEAWSKQGETIAQYLSKGKPIFVEGRVKMDEWTDKESGQKRSKLKVVVESFQFIGAPKGDNADQPHVPTDTEARQVPPDAKAKPSGKAPAKPTEAPAASGGSGDGDDNIPFRALVKFSTRVHQHHRGMNFGRQSRMG